MAPTAPLNHSTRRGQRELMGTHIAGEQQHCREHWRLPAATPVLFQDPQRRHSRGHAGASQQTFPSQDQSLVPGDTSKCTPIPWAACMALHFTLLLCIRV